MKKQSGILTLVPRLFAPSPFHSSLVPKTLRLAVAFDFHLTVKFLHVLALAELVGVHELNIIRDIKAYNILHPVERSFHLCALQINLT